jgi:hypothetical protein
MVLEIQLIKLRKGWPLECIYRDRIRKSMGGREYIVWYMIFPCGLLLCLFNDFMKTSFEGIFVRLKCLPLILLNVTSLNHSKFDLKLIRVEFLIFSSSVKFKKY